VRPFAVELAAAALIIVVLLVDLIARHGRRAVWACYLGGLALLLALACVTRAEGSVLGGAYVADGLAWFAKLLIILGAGVVGAVSLRIPAIREKYVGAYAALLLAASLGMMVLVSSKELITLYVALETSAVCLYGLAGIAKSEDRSLEAGLKYLVLGALSSGVLLYGLALLYSATGTTLLDALRSTALERGRDPRLVLGVLFLLIGTGFKLSMVPMHVWTPDVYEGAPTPVTAFISVVSKAAGFVFALRLFPYALPGWRAVWEPFLVAGAVLSMTVGNLAAIPQANIKRLLAYSSISQAGYLLVAFVGEPITGAGAILFYLLVYALANLAAFTVVIAFSSSSGSDRLEDYAGLARREPFLALALAFALLSLAGMPPFAGFIGKIYLFSAAMRAGYLWLVIVAALNSIVSLFYYLLVLRRMYFPEPAPGLPRIPVSWPVRVVLLTTLLGVIVLGVLPGPVLRFLTELSQKLLAPAAGL
jgi:NADH-quinone oxidoreductase subunit N